MSGPTECEYTNEWYRLQFRKLDHHWQRSMAIEADLEQQVRLLRKQVAEMEAERRKDVAKIGELQERLDRAAKITAMMRTRLDDVSPNNTKELVENGKTSV